MKKKKRIIVLVLLCVTLWILSACSSTDTGNISGTVTDSMTNLPIEEAVISVDGKTVITGSDGKFFLEISSGTYNITVQKALYNTYNATVTVEKDQTEDLKVAMVDTTNVGTISGIVTDGRGGPVVEDVTIAVKDSNRSTTTNANGEFSISFKADYEVELLVEAENLATMRIQAVEVAQDEELYIEIPTRDIFNPNWSAEPPMISLNIQAGQELTANQEIEVTVTGERDTYLIYAYLGGDHRTPGTLFESDTNIATVNVDTTAFPNGDTFLKVLVYDDNENGALYIVPVSINNTANDTELPDDLTYLEVVSITSGQNIGFYSTKINERLEDEYNLEFDIENTISAAPEGASLYNSVSWEPVTNADGYAIYRAFGEEQTDGSIEYSEYTLFSRVPADKTTIDDYSTQLAANIPMKYKVVPYNSFGEGNGIERMVMPLPAFNVYLETPADQAVDVSLNPKFKWRNEVNGGEFPEGTSFYSELSIFDGTSSLIWLDYIEDAYTYTLEYITLEPNSIYSWDIRYSHASVIYEYDEDDNYAYSYALSIAGEYDGTGSINGEYIFSTTTDVQ
ncbi:MAG: carboxypeptidase regulatory-like domain-containing protein [Halanaerobiales bacterium]